MEVVGIQLTQEQVAAWKKADLNNYNQAVDDGAFDEESNTLIDLSVLPDTFLDGDSTNSPFDIILRPSQGYVIQ